MCVFTCGCMCAHANVFLDTCEHVYVVFLGVQVYMSAYICSQYTYVCSQEFITEHVQIILTGVSIYMCTHGCVHMCIHCVCTSARGGHMNKCKLCSHVWVHVYVCIHVCFVGVHICVYMYVCVCTRVRALFRLRPVAHWLQSPSDAWPLPQAISLVSTANQGGVLNGGSRAHR